MSEWKVPVQSLIDHIKTAIDVDDWAKDMAEELLKEQEPKKVIIDMYGNYCPWCSTKTSREMGVQKLHLGTKFCPYCGHAISWKEG